MNEIYYTGCYIDYKNNTIKHTEKLHTSLDSVKYDINYMISCLIQDVYGIFLTDEYLFIYNPLNVALKGNTYEINLDQDNKLVFVKTGLVIDIFFHSTKKGYIYDNKDKIHLYKFYIIKNFLKSDTQTIPKFSNPEYMFHYQHINPSIKKQFMYGSPLNTISENENCDFINVRENGSIYSENDSISSIDIEDEPSQKTVTLGLNDQLLIELKEKLKLRMVIH